MAKDFYETLGVERKASKDEIKKANFSYDSLMKITTTKVDTSKTRKAKDTIH